MLGTGVAGLGWEELFATGSFGGTQRDRQADREGSAACSGLAGWGWFLTLSPHSFVLSAVCLPHSLEFLGSARSPDGCGACCWAILASSHWVPKSSTWHDSQEASETGHWLSVALPWLLKTIDKGAEKIPPKPP